MTTRLTRSHFAITNAPLSKAVSSRDSSSHKTLKESQKAFSSLSKTHATLEKNYTRVKEENSLLHKKIEHICNNTANHRSATLELDNNLPFLKNRLKPYFELLDNYSDVLGPDGDAQQGEIQIIRDLAQIQEIQKTSGQQVGIIAENKWQTWICDAVQFPDKTYGVYGRFVWKNTLTNHGTSGAAILPYTPDGKILLISIYRHATRSWQLELPRGCGEPNEIVPAIIKRELKEETGATIETATTLGATSCDTGVLIGTNVISKAQIKNYGLTNRDPAEESLALHAFSKKELNTIIKQGFAELTIQGKQQKIPCTDPYLLSALSLEKAQEPPSYYQRITQGIKNILGLFNPFRSEEF